MGNFVECCSEERRLPGDQDNDINQNQNDQDLNLYYGGQMKKSTMSVKSSSSRKNEAMYQNGQNEACLSLAGPLDEVKDNLSKYEFDEDPNYEIIEFAAYRNEREHDIEFSQRGIMDYINYMFQKENSDEESKQWEKKLSKDNIDVYIKKGGSYLNNTFPFLKASIQFNSYFAMEKLLDVISDDEHRIKFDKNFSKLKTIKNINKNCSITYALQKSAMNMSNKDFVEKQIKFCHNGVYYAYNSYIPNDAEFKAPVPKTDRAQTLIKITRIERRPSDGKIIFQMMFQSDLKMIITPKIVQMFMPGAVHTWAKNCLKYINDNYDHI